MYLYVLANGSGAFNPFLSQLTNAFRLDQCKSCSDFLTGLLNE